MAQWIKNQLASQETPALLLSRDDPLEEGMATHSSILAWRIPWTEKPSGLVHKVTKSRTQLKLFNAGAHARARAHTHTHTHTHTDPSAQCESSLAVSAVYLLPVNLMQNSWSIWF